VASGPTSDPHRSSVARVRAGDRAAFDPLYEQALSSVWQAAVAAWPQRSDAEAVTAAVLTEAFGALPELPDHADFTAYCLRVLARVAAHRAPDKASLGASVDS
jgi:DNA-directed RNA polymerase specialized sigma24 family protein